MLIINGKLITWEREKGRGAARNWKNCAEDIWFATVSREYTFNVDPAQYCTDEDDGSGTVDGAERGSIPGFGIVYNPTPNFIDKPWFNASEYTAVSAGNIASPSRIASAMLVPEAMVTSTSSPRLRSNWSRPLGAATAIAPINMRSIGLALSAEDIT